MTRRSFPTRQSRPIVMILKISVVIPTLNEASVLRSTLRKVGAHQPHEIIVADGGSVDETLSIASEEGVKIVHAPRGKSFQMNTGARKAVGEILWFLHADSAVDSKGYLSMVETMTGNEYIGGAFALGIDSRKRTLGFISMAANWRSRRLGLVYGDQGIFVRTDVFRKMGGYASLPICEDLEFFRRMRYQGKVMVLDQVAAVSPRRWQVEGTFFVTFRNLLIASLFILGFPPHLLSRWYEIIR